MIFKDKIVAATRASKGIATLLERTTLTVPFADFLREVEADYPAIGTIHSAEPILEGYEDANFKVVAANGQYVIKVFLKERQPGNVADYVRAMEEAEHLGVPVLTIVAGKQGKLSHSSADHTPYFVTEFFDGRSFDGLTPTLHDMTTVAAHLATLNTLTFPVVSAYDSWGIKNFLKEYAENKSKLGPAQNDLIAPIAAAMNAVDFTRFSTAVIHGDSQRKHILKNAAGQYCIIDFGCLANDAKMIELATHLAWFCLAEDTWPQKDEIVSAVVATYTSRHRLSAEELVALPLLVKASYAAYYLKTAVLIAEGDTSPETATWHAAAQRMLHLTQSW
jgi:Ser/Thr protein kinase RdoA (MazF antagonist)